MNTTFKKATFETQRFGTHSYLLSSSGLKLSFLVFSFVPIDKPDVWLSGFFDKDSFVETLDGWAKTVVCGRAR